MTELELLLFMWATAATALWLVARLPDRSTGARIVETSDEDPRDT